MKETIINTSNYNQRLDKFLQRLLVESSNGFIYKMLRKKNITLNDKKASGTEILKVGDSVKIYFSDETYLKLTGANCSDPYYSQLKNLKSDINIIHEDEDKIIINKPVGILSQKAEENDISLNEMALSYLINSGQMSEEDFKHFHPSVVNRLDRNTSGIVLFAKNLKASQDLSLMLKDRSCKKIYRAIVCGEIKEKQLIDGYLIKDEKHNKVQVVKEEIADAKKITTEYEPIALLDNNLSLISIHLITGRTHQIRAHLASIGHPLLGDYKYGNASVNKALKAKYQLLHAYSIEFDNGEKYVAELREDFNVYI